jgi:hypothetical protein
MTWELVKTAIVISPLAALAVGYLLAGTTDNRVLLVSGVLLPVRALKEVIGRWLQN